MKVKYKPHKNLVDADGDYLTFPLLHVRLKHGRQTIDLECLVDSGATDSLFSDDIAEALGIDLRRAEKRIYYGLGDRVVEGRLHTIKLNVAGFAQWDTFKAGFIPKNEMPLLGQSGFFDLYEITFRKFQNRFEIKRARAS